MELILIRGLPGSGKSTMARAMSEEYDHYEADMFFTDSHGEYNYDRNRIKEAHVWCQTETFKALVSGKRVVVSNTFSRLFEMKPYLGMCRTLGIELRIIEATGNWSNVHGVAVEDVEKMRQQWEQSVL